MTLSGSPAQLSSSRRLATPRLLERFRLLLLGLKWYSDHSAVAVPFQVRGAESDARERTRGRKTFLTRIEEKRQELATYGWTRPTVTLAMMTEVTHADLCEDGGEVFIHAVRCRDALPEGRESVVRRRLRFLARSLDLA